MARMPEDFMYEGQPIDEPILTGMLRVGSARFHKGVKLSTVQGAIDRLETVYQQRAMMAEKLAGSPKPSREDFLAECGLPHLDES